HCLAAGMATTFGDPGLRSDNDHRGDARRNKDLLDVHRPGAATGPWRRAWCDRLPAVALRCTHGPGRARDAVHAVDGQWAGAWALLHRRGTGATASHAAKAGAIAMSRWLPYPILSVLLLITWLLLNQSLSLAHILLGGMLSVVGPWFLVRLDTPRLTVK